MIEPHLLLALVSFALAASITPGPNNLMLLASSVNFGLRRTLPHMFGIAIGFTLMVALVGIGLGEVFKLFPLLYEALKYLGAAYMIYLAYKIAMAGPINDQGAEMRGNPLSFLQAAAFQWVNPKAWVMAVYAISSFTSAQSYLLSVAVVALIFGLVNLPSIAVWALFGHAMKPFLSNPKIIRIFNGIMALLLLASIWPILAPAN